MDGTGNDKSGGDGALEASSAEIHSMRGVPPTPPTAREGSSSPFAPPSSPAGAPEPMDLNLPCPSCGLRPSDVLQLLAIVDIADDLCNGGHDPLTKVRITNHLRQAVAVLKS